ncbi:glycosyltransferase [Candidatus Daviesbacteria bacterium]|nr:glycosyltransferase [Candidatus Daviesbacteria bacterium]
MKKVLIFYSKTGSGHLRAAEALKEAIEAQKSDAEVILHEGMEKGRFGIPTKASALYGHLSNKLQPVYNFLYVMTNNKLGTRALRFLVKKGLGRNLKKVIEETKPDLIISVHALLSRSTVKKTTHSVPFITVVTDLGLPHRIWFDEEAEMIITPTRSIAEAARRLAKNTRKVEAIDYPLKKQFTQRHLGRKFNNTILVLGGGEGAGDIKKQTEVLLRDSNRMLVVVCGKNKRLYKKLSGIDNPRLKVFGFVDNLPELYNRSDIVITKAGPGTIVEAATLKKPLIITSWVGIQERDNVEFVTENNLGIYEPKIENLGRAVEKIYQNYDYYNRGQSFFQNGSKKIVEYILKEYD